MRKFSAKDKNMCLLKSLEKWHKPSEIDTFKAKLAQEGIFFAPKLFA